MVKENKFCSHNMKENGRMINNMELAMNSGKMEVPSLDIITCQGSMELAYTSGQMVIHIKGCGKTTL